MPNEQSAVDNLQNEIEKLHHINQLVLDSVAEGIYGIDLEANVIFWNKAAEELTGFSITDFKSNNLHELIHHTNNKGEHVPIHQCPVYHALKDGESLFIEDDLFWRKDGSSFPVEFTVNPMLEKNHHVGTVITFRDMTEKKKTEAILQEWEKLSLVGQMSAGIAHEIRNPITSLKGFVQLIRSHNEFKEEYFNIMDSEFNRMESIIQELLSFSKPQLTNYQKHDLNQLILQVVMLMEPHATLKNIEIKTNLPSTPIFITCIDHQIKQVLINLVKNALEAIMDKGTISIKLNKQDSKAILQVRDDGMGMTAEQIEKVGNPFFSTKNSGTGLGMMITNNIIKHNHQGTLEIQSELKKGSTFTIKLPIDLNVAKMVD